MEGSGSTKTAGPARSGLRPRQVALLALGLLVIVFALLNSRSVKVNFIVTTTTAPLIIVVVACLAIGIGLGLLAARRDQS